MRMKACQQDNEHVTNTHVQSPSTVVAPLPKQHGMVHSLLNMQHIHGNQLVQQLLNQKALQRKLGWSGAIDIARECDHCSKHRETAQHSAASETEFSAVPSIVHEVLRLPGRPLEPAVRAFMEPRFGRDFSQVQIHTDAKAAQSARAVNALAYTVGRDIVFAEGQYEPGAAEGLHLLAHELTHTLQQANAGGTHQITGISQPGDVYEQEAEQVAGQIMRMSDPQPAATDPAAVAHPPPPRGQRSAFSALQRQDEATSETVAGENEGFEIGDQLMVLFPRWQMVSLPADAVARTAGGRATPNSLLSRQGGGSGCDAPRAVRKVISGSFEGGKTLDDYYPDLVGTNTWGSNNTAGPFDNGSRAGSSVQLIGEYWSPCTARGTNFTFGQTATIVRARANGRRMMEGGRALEGQTIDDIARSGRDQSRAPFRQEWSFAISVADPISGIPYASLTSYEFEVNLTTSVTGPGGAGSVNWGITVEASGGRVTRNEVR